MPEIVLAYDRIKFSYVTALDAFLPEIGDEVELIQTSRTPAQRRTD